MEKTSRKSYTIPETIIAEAETGAFICTSIHTLQLTAPQVDQYVTEETVDIAFE